MWGGRGALGVNEGAPAGSVSRKVPVASSHAKSAVQPGRSGGHQNASVPTSAAAAAAAAAEGEEEEGSAVSTAGAASAGRGNACGARARGASAGVASARSERRGREVARPPRRRRWLQPRRPGVTRTLATRCARRAAPQGYPRRLRRRQRPARPESSRRCRQPRRPPPERAATAGRPRARAARATGLLRAAADADPLTAELQSLPCSYTSNTGAASAPTACNTSCSRARSSGCGALSSSPSASGVFSLMWPSTPLTQGHATGLASRAANPATTRRRTRTTTAQRLTTDGRTCTRDGRARS